MFSPRLLFPFCFPSAGQRRLSECAVQRPESGRRFRLLAAPGVAFLRKRRTAVHSATRPTAPRSASLPAIVFRYNGAGSWDSGHVFRDYSITRMTLVRRRRLGVAPASLESNKRARHFSSGRHIIYLSKTVTRSPQRAQRVNNS